MPIRPAPGGRPLVGHIPAYRRDRLAFFAGCANGPGAVTRVRLPRDGYVLTEPEDVRHVLVANHRNYVKSRRLAAGRGEYPRPYSLLTSRDDEHRRRRRALQPLFRRPLVEGVVERARANAERLAASWPDGAEVDVAPALVALAQRNLLETLLGPASEQRLDELATASRARKRAFERHFVSLFPLPQYLPTGANGAYVRATRRLGAAIAAEIDARRGAGGRAGDLLSLLMDATFDDGGRLTDREVREEVFMLSLTGYDSVGEALAWALYLVARDPAVQEAVARESREAPAASGAPYATRVVMESLRLYPPTWIFVRVARHEDPLPSGARIPAGAKVYLCPYLVQRDPRHWPDPDRFDPDRFADGAEDGRPRYAYFPFGGGPHVCIGETLAVGQVVTVLATLVARHRLALAPAPEVVPEGGLTMRPKHGLRLRVERRAT